MVSLDNSKVCHHHVQSARMKVYGSELSQLLFSDQRGCCSDQLENMKTSEAQPNAMRPDK